MLRMRKVRSSSGITLDRLEHQTGIPVCYLQRIERGRRDPWPTQRKAIESVLGTSEIWRKEER